MSRTCDVVVVGAGLSGLTVAIAAARTGLDVTIVDELGFGGHLNNMPFAVDPSGRTGTDIVGDLAVALADSGAEFVVDRVDAARRVKDGVVVTGDGFELSGRIAVAASGRADAEADVPGSTSLHGRGVSHCVGCDAPLFKGVAVAAVIAGPSPYLREEIDYLATFASQVHVIGGDTAGLTEPVVGGREQDRVVAVNGAETVSSVTVAGPGEAPIELEVAGVLALGMGAARVGWIGELAAEATQGHDAVVQLTGSLADPDADVAAATASAEALARTLEGRLR